MIYFSILDILMYSNIAINVYFGYIQHSILITQQFYDVINLVISEYFVNEEQFILYFEMILMIFIKS